MANVGLKGRVKRTVTHMLEHSHFCEKVGVCSCESIEVGSMKKSKITKKQSPVFRTFKVPATIAVAYGRVTVVDEAALSVPSIASAVKGRRIIVIR